ncbi:hypothetical protein GCM10023091_41570 [Ravibacter arvi]|uniref:Beta-lactamase-inhibitor-like PepSY-like domain-containing protein n=1 Tax=Ravibacter arvi TaxID=2051041 RepID=A0ABP8MD44_9BACT
MKKKLPVTLLALAILLSIYGCKVEDLQNADQPIPESVTQIIPSQFSGAEDILIKTVEKDSLWEATYSLNGLNYFTATDREQIVYNALITNTPAPDNVLKYIENSTIAGGTIDNMKVIQPNSFANEFVNYGEYLFQGKQYRIMWDRHMFKIRLSPHSKILLAGSSFSPNKDKLPSRIKQYLSDNYLSMTGYEIRYDNNNNKLYHVVAKSPTTIYWIRFNAQQKIVGTNFSPDQLFQTRDELPAAVKNTLQKQTFLSNLKFSGGRRNSTETGIVYGAVFTNNATAESLSLEFKPDGTPLWMEYSRY